MKITRVLLAALLLTLVGPAPMAGAAPGDPPLPPVAAPAGVCTGTEEEPQLEPEALGTLNVRSDDPAVETAASLGFDGSGVSIGVVSTYLDPAAPNFLRADGTPVVVDYRSYTHDGPNGAGEGSEAFGDVSSIGAQGTVTYDLADHTNAQAVTLPDGHCWIRVVGVAPGADIIASNAYDGGTLTAAAAVQAIEDSVEAGVDVLSFSFNWTTFPDVSDRAAVLAATSAAIDAGVTVVASAGDAGANSTIGSPAADPRVIGVGASTDSRIYAQTGAAGTTRFGNGDWSPGTGTSAQVSSSGITGAGTTIDVLAPGDTDWATCSADPRFQECSMPGNPSQQSDLFAFGGTSQSAPFVAGVVGLIIQAYREGHGGADPTPAQVQEFLTATATDLGLPSDLQGHGLVDAHAAVLAAGGGAALVADPGVFVAGRGAAEVAATVRNTGDIPLPVGDVVLTSDTPTVVGSRIVAPDAAGPAFVDGLTGDPMVFSSEPVDLPAGLPWAKLTLTAASAVPEFPYIAQAVVIGPDGSVAAFGSAFAGGLQVWLPQPAAGRWTVVLQGAQGLSWTGRLTVAHGARQVVAVGAADQPVLEPGESTTVRVPVDLAVDPGDLAATLRVGDAIALPVVLRTVADLDAGPLEVTGEVLPGNGRGGAAAQTATWDMDVPEGAAAVTVDAGLDGPVDAAVAGVLIDPSGTVRSLGDNLATDDPAGSVQQTVLSPEPGRWQYRLVMQETRFTAPYTGGTFRVRVSTDALPAAVEGLPERLTVGEKRSVAVSFTNTTVDPMVVMVDPRLDDVRPVELRPVTPGSADVSLPITDQQGVPPIFIVPPFTDTVRVGVRSTVPVLIDTAGPAGVPGAVSAPSTAPSLSFVGDDAIPGPWSVLLGPPGPVGVSGSPSGSAVVSVQAVSAAFDATVTDASGTALVTEAGVAADPAFLTVAPGATVRTEVTLHAPSTVGDVSGFLALRVPARAAGGAGDGWQLGSTTGDVVAVFPYRYEVVAPSTSSSSAPTSPSTSAPTSSAPTSGSTSAVPPTTSTPPQLSATGADVGGLALGGWVIVLAGGLVLALAAMRAKWRSMH
ncbi:S8 family serine peptidase [Nakamurella sp. YIM 132087]|uniref:S8 family serine peptidase n=1 Tax=Nakamurella alba TaxID=2665158 RepID=A0A7K1FKK2_9ACTN|nr:S8 family serine peptidase [Nakamurella alba]MTD13394.1 S8 family serine peptidase [Nakamurella alba]